MERPTFDYNLFVALSATVRLCGPFRRPNAPLRRSGDHDKDGSMSSHVLMAVPDLPGVAPHQAFLARQGLEVALSGDGLDCAEQLRRNRPDVLVLALNLPWGRGEGVLALMTEGELPRVPVVLLSEQSYLPRLSLGRYPVQTYLPWPTPPRLLLQAIRAVLSTAPLGRPSAEVEARADEWSPAPWLT
jgi:DNA-binding NtrC family response regulator